MEYIEYSKENACKEAIHLAETVKKDYTPDLVVFVSKGAYQIGLDMGSFFDVPVSEIFAERRGGRLKKIVSPLLKVLPSGLKRRLRAAEIKSGKHKTVQERNVYWGYISEAASEKKAERILLVDDSCDTGNTFIGCVKKIKEKYPGAEIRTAAINVFSSSFDVIKTDYYLHKDCMLSGPWSNDSSEHGDFISGYNKYYGTNQSKA